MERKTGKEGKRKEMTAQKSKGKQDGKSKREEEMEALERCNATGKGRGQGKRGHYCVGKQ